MNQLHFVQLPIYVAELLGLRIFNCRIQLVASKC